MSFVDALHDPDFLGVGPFKDLEPWAAWLDFYRAFAGLPLDDEGVRRVLKATGLKQWKPREGGYTEAVAIVGRQAGKTQFGTGILAYEAVTYVPTGGGDVYALLIAQDHRAAVRTAFAYVSALFDQSPLLSEQVTNRTADTISLTNGVTIAAYPCRPAAIRGLMSIVRDVDELAYFVSSDMRRVDTEMLRALRPTSAMTGGRTIILSSPYGQEGELWNIYRRCYGREDANTLVWQSSAPEMNPLLSSDYLKRMQLDDPEAYRSEVLGEFRAGLSTLLDPDAIEACVVTDRRELSPVDGVSYSAFVDTSGGRADAFTVAIGHRDQGARRWLRRPPRAVVDAVRAWPAPFNPASVTAECCDLLKRYRVSRVTGDRFGGEFPREQFRLRGVQYDVAELDRSKLYLELLPRVNAGTIELLDDAALLRELRGLERRRGSSGRDRVDHRAGSHDDLANSVAGLSHMIFGGRQPGDVGVTIGGVSNFANRTLQHQHGWSSEPRSERMSERNPLDDPQVRARLALDAANRRVAEAEARLAASGASDTDLFDDIDAYLAERDAQRHVDAVEPDAQRHVEAVGRRRGIVGKLLRRQRTGLSENVGPDTKALAEIGHTVSVYDDNEER